MSRRSRADMSQIDVSLVPDELKPLIQAINAHIAQTSKVTSAQKQFVADAAHQLKTPLTLLRTQADFASKQRDPAAVNEVLDELRANSERISRLVDQLLALNRAEAASAPVLEEIDLTDFARTTTFEWLPLALGKAIDLGFEGEGPVKVRANRVLLHELLANPIDNAIRFTPAGGHITVRVTSHEGRALLSVEDSGPGIPEFERERVFDRFYQIPGRDSLGCGLGLAITREIATLHQAKLQLQDVAQGTGTVFLADFPLSETTPAPPSP